MSFMINTSVSKTQGFVSTYTWEPYIFTPTYMTAPVYLNRLPSGDYHVSMSGVPETPGGGGPWYTVIDFSVVPGFTTSTFLPRQLNCGVISTVDSGLVTVAIGRFNNASSGLLEIQFTDYAFQLGHFSFDTVLWANRS